MNDDISSMQSVGKIILHHSNGDEEFALEEAIIGITEYEGKIWLYLEAKTNGTLIKSFPYSESLHGRPRAAIEIAIEEAQAMSPVGTKFLLPDSYDAERDLEAARFYYVEHASIEENELLILLQQDTRFLVKWTGRTDLYIGDEPDTAIEIEGWFTLDRPNPFA